MVAPGRQAGDDALEVAVRAAPRRVERHPRHGVRLSDVELALVDVEAVGPIQPLEQNPTPVRPPVPVGVAEEQQDVAAARLADQEVAGLRDLQEAGPRHPLREQPDRGPLGAADAASEGALRRGLYAPPQERLPEGDVDLPPAAAAGRRPAAGRGARLSSGEGA